MANTTVYPYGTGGSLPASIGIIDDLVTGGANKALSAQQGVVINGMFQSIAAPTGGGGKNLYNPESNTQSTYFNTSGGENHENANYAVTDYIKVEAGETYNLSGINTTTEEVSVLGSNTACLNIYNSAKVRISTVPEETQTFIMPSGAAYIRASVRVVSLTEIQIEKGSSRSTYEPYIAAYEVIIPNGKITYDKLSADAKDKIQRNCPSVRVSGTIAASSTLRAPISCHIVKNTLLSSLVSGEIGSVLIGVGANSSGGTNYAAHWVEITQTQVKHYWNNGATTLLNTYVHNLALTNKTEISIDTSIDGQQDTVLTITTDLGDVFTQALSAWGVGVPYVKNGGSSDLDVSLSFMVRDILKPLWLFGDSYVNFVNNERWPYYLVERKLTKWLSNSQPGITAADSYSDLTSLLSLGATPSILVWTLGMNGGNDTSSGGEYIINSAQKTVIDNVVSLCQQKEITLILATIPTVPARQRTGFCNYVKSLGVRYIDFADAVGATPSGEWNNGLLNTADNTHPTAAGAKVLAARALIDCAELSISI